MELIISMNNIKEIFDEVYNCQPNFMTPHIIEYGRINDELIYELSQGEGFNRNTLIGVTTLAKIDGEWIQTKNINKSFSNTNYHKALYAAREYIDFLGGAEEED